MINRLIAAKKYFRDQSPPKVKRLKWTSYQERLVAIPSGARRAREKMTNICEEASSVVDTETFASDRPSKGKGENAERKISFLVAN